MTVVYFVLRGTSGGVAMLGVGSMDKYCIACLPRSMEDALYIHEVLQRNGHLNRGRTC